MKITEAIAKKVSGYNRRRKWKIFCERFDFGADTKILDAGFTNREYKASDNYLEKHFPYSENITALGVDGSDIFAARYPEVETVLYDGQVFPFADGRFDIAWSNAVLEHVGGEEAQIKFLKEMKRVSKKTFLTTPNKFFPVEIHTRVPLLHLLPKRWFDAYLKMIGKSWAAGDYMNLLTLRRLEKILKAAGIGKHEIIRHRLGGFVLEFIVIF